MLESLLQAVGTHVLLELPLVALQSRSGVRIGQDVALDELLAFGAVLEALFEVVCGALALELEGLCLQGAALGVSFVRSI